MVNPVNGVNVRKVRKGNKGTNGNVSALSYGQAMEAARKAGTLSMEKAGRKAWSRADYNAAVKVFNDLYPQSPEERRAGLTVIQWENKEEK